ncbi:MAG: phage tail tape measure protein [Phycisphaerae bacterium]|jgi:TP901 family phage tail tape measure protein
MAGARAIEAGRAVVRISATDTQLQAALRRAQARMAAFGASVQSVGRKLFLAGGAALAPLGIGSKQFADFEQEMARVKALTNASGAAFESLSNEARRLGAQTVFTATQAAEAMSFFALAGFSVDSILKATAPTLNLAAAGQMDVASAADIAAKIMAGMGVSASDVGYALDVLTKAMTTANTDLRQIGDAFKYLGPVAKAAGLSLEETTAAIQILSNAGIQADMAGTTLRGAILSLTQPSAEAKKKLAELGVSTMDSAGNFRGLADIIDDMNAGLAGMGSGKRLEAIGTIFDARQAAGFAELLTQGGERLRQFTAALGSAGGTAERIAQTQLNTLTGTTVILTSALEGLGISVGEAFSGVLRVAIGQVTKFVNALNQWVRANPDLVFMIGAAAAATAALGAALIGVGVFMHVAAFATGVLGAAVSAVAIAFKAALAVMVALPSITGGFLILLGGLGAEMAMQANLFSRAAAFIGEAFANLRDFVGKVLGGIRDALVAGDMETAGEVLFAGLGVVWAKGVAVLRETWENLKSWFIRTAYEIWYGALQGAQWVWHQLETTWWDVVAGLARAWVWFTSGMQHAWNAIQNWLQHRWFDLMELFGELTPEQAQIARDFADDEFADLSRDIDQGEQQAQADIDRRRRERALDAEKIHREMMERLQADLEAAQQAVATGASAQLETARKKLADAQQRLAEAIAKAGAARQRAEADEQQKRAFADAGGQAQAGVMAALRTTSAATFNPAAIFGITGGGPQRRLDELTKEARIAAWQRTRMLVRLNETAAALAEIVGRLA